ncbi:hypothetical protein BJX66DRAFT_341832 [Aspergillus keveii]|uniref:BZIP transcription factor n=1 Tax=Aspergillus keveii TaxID=714993 RepID=A0ABR4FU40_9EURO
MARFRERTNVTDLEAALEAEDKNSQTEESQEEQPVHNTRSRKRAREQAGSEAENANVASGRNKPRRANSSKSPRADGSSPTSVESQSQPHRPVHGIPEDYTFVMQVGPNAMEPMGIPMGIPTRISARRPTPEPLDPLPPANAEQFNQLTQNGRPLEFSNAGPLEPVSNQQQMSAYGPQRQHSAWSVTNVETWLSNSGAAEALPEFPEYPDPEQNILSFILPEIRDTDAFAHSQPDLEPQSLQATQDTVPTTDPEQPTNVIPEVDTGREQDAPETTIDATSIDKTLRRIHNMQAIKFHRLQMQIAELIEQASAAKELSNRAGQMRATLQQPGGLFDLDFDAMEKLVKDDESNPGHSD